MSGIKHYTSNGVEITPGLRVFTTDWKWGTVEPKQFTRGGHTDPGGTHFNGWFDVGMDDNGGLVHLNGERMTTVKPASLR